MNLCGNSSSDEQSAEEGSAAGVYRADEPEREQSGRAPRVVTGLERVEISRQLFEARMKDVAFSSWEELLTALAADGPSGLGYEYSALHGDSGTHVKLDPGQVFGMLATILGEVCVWGIVFYFASLSNRIVGLILTVGNGILLWHTVHKMERHLASMVWVNLPCSVAAAGFLIALMLGDLIGTDIGSTVGGGLILGCCIIPQTLAAAFWMRALKRDPDRAVLVSNLFLGVFAAIITVYTMACDAEFNTSHLYYFSAWTLFVMALGAVTFAGWGYGKMRSPGTWASVELVSWVLNVGALALDVAVHLLLCVPFTWEHWRWLLFALLPLALGLLGASFGRSIPMVLSALCCLTLAIHMSFEVADVTQSVIAGLCTSGVSGIAILAITQCLWKSAAWSRLVGSEGLSGRILGAGR
mmetsp:Transcript_70181/g.157691  ORF Transcript_70181/g.157691 Transcript_70181/m.157691 type:complete len:412 (-) Transcript_70181:22-1257(-)